jgi:hypothetical protein
MTVGFSGYSNQIIHERLLRGLCDLGAGFGDPGGCGELECFDAMAGHRTISESSLLCHLEKYNVQSQKSLLSYMGG